MRRKSGSLIAVTWEDSTNVATWQEHDEAINWAQSPKASWIVTNVGRVVSDTSDYVLLAGRFTTDGEHLGLVERIPKRAIINIQTLSLGRR